MPETLSSKRSEDTNPPGNVELLSVIIPVYNEEELLHSSLLQVEEKLREIGLPFEVVVVSNGSTDRTDEIGRQLAEQYHWLRFFSLEERGGGRAFVHGARSAHGTFIITLDIDLSSGLEFLHYVAELSRFADMIVGSKTFGSQRRTFVRVLGSQLYILCTQLTLDMTISDYSMGYKAFRRAKILPALEHLDPWTGYIFELALYLKLRGASILQIGIDCNDTRISRFNIWHEGLYRFRHLARCWKQVKDPSSWLHMAGASEKEFTNMKN